MKYLILLFLVLTGCATTSNSEYWHGCADTANLFTHNNVPASEVGNFCDAMERENVQQQRANQFLRDGRK